MAKGQKLNDRITQYWPNLKNDTKIKQRFVENLMIAQAYTEN